MKFLSIDIETTGLDPKKHDILEVGIIAYDSNVGELWRQLFIVAGDKRWDMDTLKFHKDRLDRWYGPFDTVPPNTIITHKEHLWTDITNHIANAMVPVGASGTSCTLMQNIKLAAGKNFASFDLAFLRELPGYEPFFHHRTLDLGNLALSADDTEIPRFETCLQRCGVPFTDSEFHTALADAELCGKAICNFFNRRMGL